MPIWRSLHSRHRLEPGVIGKPNILPRRSSALVFLFRLYLRWFFWRRFEAVRILGTSLPPQFAGRPLLIYCNHPSWWDPALMLLTIPKFFPSRRGFGPMEASALKRYGVLRIMGIFGIDTQDPGAAARFLRAARDILRAPETVLCVTAEGEFTDPRLRPVKLRRGLSHVSQACPEAIFLPLALEYSFWNESKPEALMAFGKPLTAQAGVARAEMQCRLEQALQETMDNLAEASSRRTPEAFRLIYRGTSGVGGLYDLWRRLRATLRGEGFEARHQPEPPT
jgi:1-acyl-sn-glycerol-3-phosphate acyltransferase